MSTILEAPVSAPALTEDQARAIAVDAYVYFYPLVTMDVTRKQTTNMRSGEKPGFGPMNMFHNIPAFPPADLKAVVRINFDTLYSIAWLDLIEEPMVVGVPDVDGRFNCCPCSTCGRTFLLRRAGRPLGRRPPISW